MKKHQIIFHDNFSLVLLYKNGLNPKIQFWKKKLIKLAYNQIYYFLIFKMGNNSGFQSWSRESDGQNAPQCNTFCLNIFSKKVLFF